MIIKKIKNAIPTKTKIAIFQFFPNLVKKIKIVEAKIRGINYIVPDRSIPYYYIFYGIFGSQSTIVDVGCGIDADFSVYMIKKYGLKSIGVDPTLKHKEILATLSKKMNGQFIHKLLAVSALDGKIAFNQSEDYESGSIFKDHRFVKNNRIRTYDVESVSLSKLPERLGLSKIEYIKLDIEGAEYDLIENLKKEDLKKYDQIFIEFHHHALPQYSKQDTLNRVEKIKSFGFKSFSIDNHNFLFYNNL